MARPGLSLAFALAAIAFFTTGCTRHEESARTRVGVVAKSLGSGFFDAVRKGADEAAVELGAEVIFTGPATPTAEGQIDVVNALVAQRVDAIAISANDPDALVPALKRAMVACSSASSETRCRWSAFRRSGRCSSTAS